ncbi:MAG: ribonuclease R [Pseudomonadota bacterium]
MAGLPEKQELLEWIRANPKSSGKRDVARAFGIKGPEKQDLKRLLIELAEAGEIARRGRRFENHDLLPRVAILVVTGPDSDGDLFARPEKWDGDGDPPRLLIKPRKKDPALAAGDRVLARTYKVADEDYDYESTPIKRIGLDGKRMLGVFRKDARGGRIEPVEKRANRDWLIPRGEENGAEDGELVEAEELSQRRFGLPQGRIIARHGDPQAPRKISLIALLRHQIPVEFPDAVLEQADAAAPIEDPGDREDLRDLPLVTIDPPDARDHDDAVCALADDDPANPGGFIVWIAIADVAHYVTPGSPLDREARKRGNSTYFPDLVNPMLPEELSADLCSLRAGVDRPCLAVRMVLNAEGDKIDHRFTRGLMNSRGDLHYAQVQAVQDGADVDLDPGLHAPLGDLFAAYRCAVQARDKRQPLALDLPERQIVLDDDGKVASIRFRDRLDAHRLIEEFMILANVCAAETLEQAKQPLLYRVHEEPNPDKLDALREVVETMGLTLAKGQVLRTRHLNRLLTEAQDSDGAEVVSMAVLRAQTQAYYAPQNFGHFGLNLKRYAHFTSPIRRYADLLVHRALVSALKAGPDGLSAGDREELAQTAEHISQSERRSMEAERDTVDRYVAAYLADRTGAEFPGKISGISRGGIFVKLEETGADGLIPISTIGSDYLRHDPDSQTLEGERTGVVYRAGLAVMVRLVEATPITGGLIFELLEVEGSAVAQSRGRGKPARGARRKLAKAKIRKIKSDRKARRRI